MLTHKILTSGYYYSRVAREPNDKFKLIPALSFYRVSVILKLTSETKNPRVVINQWKNIFLIYQRVIQDGSIKRFLSMDQL